MAVSVRMDPLLEKELTQAAKRRGVTKSQFIVEAVQRALGRNNPGVLYLRVMEEMASYNVDGEVNAPSGASDQAAQKSALRNKLRARHTQESADYADFLARQAPGTEVEQALQGFEGMDFVARDRAPLVDDLLSFDERQSPQN